MPSTKLTKSEFESLWTSSGYRENYQAYPPGTRQRIVELVGRYAMPNGVALDIGCGDGSSTNELLVPNFGKVIALDLLDKPACLVSSVEYHQVPDFDYTCHGIADQSIDFVWSFGCFCHLPKTAVFQYLGGIKRVLKPSSAAVAMFANWPRHYLRRWVKNPEQYRETCDDGQWFYCDLNAAMEMAVGAGFGGFTDLWPDFRDTIAELRP